MQEKKPSGKVGILKIADDPSRPERVDVGKKIRYQLGVDAEDIDSLRLFLTRVGILLLLIIALFSTIGLGLRLFLYVGGFRSEF